MKLADEGNTLPQIAKLTGYSYATVCTVCKQLGIKVTEGRRRNGTANPPSPGLASYRTDSPTGSDLDKAERMWNVLLRKSK